MNKMILRVVCARNEMKQGKAVERQVLPKGHSKKGSVETPELRAV